MQNAIMCSMIKSHYEKVIADCADKAQLCVVTKKRSIEEILPFYDAGERIFGENHASELTEKAKQMPSDIRWQFIGHLQRNKVRQILPYVDCIQSLDSTELAAVIEKECIRINRTVDVFAEFHLADEDTNKTGLDAADAVSFVTALKDFPHLHLSGIMAMGPHTDDKERIREVFMQAKDLFEMLKQEFPAEDIHTLSMGMSHDYGVALECGSNMVRIGSYLFTE